MKNQNHIAETIKEIRRIHKLTQEDLAELIHMSPGHIGMLEQGRTHPSYDTLDKLITKFDLDANIFFPSRNGNKELLAAEIYKLLDPLSEKQAIGLVQIFRVGTLIMELSDRNDESGDL